MRQDPAGPRFFLVYSHGKTGSATIASRIQADRTVELDWKPHISEHFRHNVGHLHVFASLESVMGAIADQFPQALKTIIYSYRLDFMAQARSAFFQYFKHFSRRPASACKRYFEQAEVEDFRGLLTLPFASTCHGFDLFLTEVYLAGLTPVDHLADLLRWLGLPDDGSFEIERRTVYPSPRGVRLAFVETQEIDGDSGFLNELTHGCYAADKRSRNRTSDTRVGALSARLKNEFQPSPDVSRTLESWGREGPFSGINRVSEHR